MRELIKPFLFLILLIPFATVTNAYAFMCGGVECNPGEYCGPSGPGGTLKCAPCNELPNNEYPHSDVDDDPAKGTGVCYKICEEIEITNGKWVPEADKAYYNSACEYKLGCNDYDKPCYGFHPDDNNESCISNEQDCSDETGDGFKYWLFNATGTSEYSKCYITTCKAGYHLKESGQYICEKPYGECVSNTAKCASLLKNCDGTITGNAEWNDAGWDYDNCRCETASSCPWESGEGDDTKWSESETDCIIRDVTACDVGYCEHKDYPGSCAAARPGWYHDNDTSAECQPCPAGMTSDGTDKESNKIADSIEKCGMRTGPNGTRFCDMHGCFTLPGNGELIYYKAW